MLQAALRLVLAVAAVAAASHAAVVYEFSGMVNPPPSGFVLMFRYTSPAFITTDTFVPYPHWIRAAPARTWRASE